MKLKSIAHHKTSQEKKKLFMTVFITVIMVSSIAGFAMTNYTSMDSVKIHNRKFYSANGIWQTNVNFYGKPLTLKTTILPNETVKTPDIGFGDFKDKIVYVALNPDFKSYNLQLFLQLVSGFALRMQNVCLPSWNFSFCQQLPVKECSTIPDSFLIIFDDGNENIIKQKNCLILKADINQNQTQQTQTDSNKLIDSVLFRLFNIN